ncbi:protein of unknown function [Taphrina deformans PYCC 5710]|uniref:Sn-1,2-diacylglycerol cholinephosphotransferase n=1 Tax=Taphrina deformans (strain PYCC 5710 / ATCC 11124 / CBS 356.35 / IMI 108563 / JCM 9778 / NBRC 8474) TaxID=1097556 RepID=R4XIL9_TAPDE|nr:protein of unknown function [Taphrina deformans PYCC 5710]|eukprot:CCG84349.1 protein of unknown function [Taphrina deformans PYCC 5710]
MGAQDLSALKLYKYAAVDKSPLSYYILTPFWNYATTLFPMWVAPNLITLMGLIFILINIATIEYYIPDLVGPGPSWLYFSLALGLFLYQTFDNVDGKQARRTGSSSPLGELFDHGIDSLNCTLGGIVLCAAMGFGSTVSGAVVVIISSWPMFFSSWEQYHTGILYLGYFNGPTEGIVIACLCMVISGVFGPAFWHRPVVENFGHSAFRLFGNTKMDTLFLVMIFFALFVVHIPFCIYNVHVARSRKGLSTTAPLVQWVPLLVFTGAAATWLLSPHSIVLRDNHLVLFGFFICLIFGRMTTKIILAHLLRQEFPMFTTMLVPLIVGSLVVNVPSLGLPKQINAGQELAMLQICLGISALMYSHWAISVIHDFTTYLDIDCLTIPTRKVKA